MNALLNCSISQNLLLLENQSEEQGVEEIW